MNISKLQIIRMLCLSIFGLFATSTFAQQSANEVFPKGQFLEGSTPAKSFQKSQILYSADAKQLASDFTSKDFSLQTLNGVKFYGTGKYLPNANLQTKSLKINVPNTAKDRIYLEIVQSLETESRYDYASVWVKADGNDVEVYRRSGKTAQETAYINLTAYAGKQIEITLRLNADDTEQGSGWNIYNVELFKGKRTDMRSTTRGNTNLRLKGGGSNVLNILGVNAEAFPDAIFVEFTVKDDNGDHVSGLTEADFDVWDDKQQKIGCLKLKEVTAEKTALDIVFLVDNSGSMSDDQAKLAQAIPAFLTALQANFDANVGLIRFGQGQEPACPNYGTIEKDANGKFFYNLDTELNTFLSTIWSRNTSDGSYEPYYEVLNWAAKQGLPYRSQVKTVFIMLGDEKVEDDYNNYQCDHSTLSTLTDASVANTLNNSNSGIQTFFICDEGYADGAFDLIASQTGGLVDNIYATSYDDLLDAFAQELSNKYVLRYCLDIDPAQVNPNIPREVIITDKNDPNTTDTKWYNPIGRPSIVRSPATQALTNVMQPNNVAIPIDVTVIQNGYTLDYIDFYYKDESTTTFTKVTKSLNQGTLVNGNVDFSFSIPSGTANHPKVSYYFEAMATISINGVPQSTLVSSPPNNKEFFAWTIGITPNYPPSITNVVVPQVAMPCNPATICATVTDNTLYLDGNPIVKYRMANSQSVYLDAEMFPSGNNVYCATIPAGAIQTDDIEYYIVAKDNYGTLGLYGDPTTPMILPLNNQPPSSGGHQLDLIVNNYANVMLGCDAMLSTDLLEAYFVNDCNVEQLAGRGTWNGSGGGFTLTVYGDAVPNDGVKDGFFNGEKIILKLIRNGKDYGLQTSTLKFTTSSPYLMVSAGAGAGSPKIGVKGNNVSIANNSTSYSTSNNTDFGNTDDPLSKTFVIKNLGCETLVLKDITVSNVGFTIVNQNVPTGSNTNSFIELAPEAEYQLEIEYDGLTELAVATVTIYTNDVSNDPFKFNIKGESAIVDPCAGITLAPNPITTGAYLIYDVANNNTDVEIFLMSIMGNWSKHFYNGTVQAGTQFLYISNSGVNPGMYILVVRRNNLVCPMPVIFQ